MASTFELQDVGGSHQLALDSPEHTLSHVSITSSEPTANAVERLAPVTRRDQIVVLISGFFAVFQTIGPNLSYGVFQAYYLSSSDTMLPTEETTNRALIAFIGNLGAGLTWGGSIYTQPLMSRVGSNKSVAFAGAVLMSLGFLCASFASRTWHLLLTQGLMYGIGSSLFYFPIVTIASPYFTTRRGAATGFILSAAGIGGLVFSFSIQSLLSTVGPSWTLRAMALEAALVCIPVALAARKSRTVGLRSGRSADRSLLSWSIAKKPTFILQFAAALLQAGGNFVPLTFLPEFSTILGYSASFGAALLAINNAVNSVARIATGFLADRFGRQNVLILSVLGSAISVLSLWMAAADSTSDEAKGTWITFVVLYGALAGGYNALFPATIPELFPLSAYAPINSLLYFARGLGTLFGSPVGGQILGNSRSGSTMSDIAQALQDYRKVIWYDGALLTACTLWCVGGRIADAVDRKHWRWQA